MFAQEKRSRFSHRENVQRRSPVINIPEEKRTEKGSVKDAVLVDLGSSHFPGVEVRRGGVYRDNPDIFGQEGVEGPEKLPLGKCEAGPKMSDLSQGMDTGISPARADDRNFFLDDFGQGFFDNSLDRSFSGLFLPAVKIRPVITQVNFVCSGHGLSRAESEADGFFWSAGRDDAFDFPSVQADDLFTVDDSVGDFSKSPVLAVDGNQNI